MHGDAQDAVHQGIDAIIVLPKEHPSLEPGLRKEDPNSTTISLLLQDDETESSLNLRGE
jgi:hypothetical protein